MFNKTNEIADLQRHRWGSILTMIMLLVAFISLTVADTSYEVKNPMVSPEFGYDDFIYSAQIGISGENTDVSGKFKVELKIYDGERLLRSESLPDRRLNQEEIMNRLSDSFTSQSINFERDFGIQAADNASFEFIVYKNNGVVASEKRRGPVVSKPNPIINYDRLVYFVQPLSVTVSAKDLRDLSPSCHLDISGPKGGKETSWTTSEVSCTPAGDAYTCQIAEDMSNYRAGGNFSFFVVYSNLKLDPIVLGPYNFTVSPYDPSIELFEVPSKLDYKNFSIRLYVKDLGRYIVGGTAVSTNANLTITHPGREAITSVKATPQIEGEYLVFEWGPSDIKFDRGDVELSKEGPFKAAAEFKSDRWSYAVISEKSFDVVEEIPILDTSYNRMVYVRSGTESKEKITATVGYSKGKGDLMLRLEGPGISMEESKSGQSLGAGKYLYEWEIVFDEGDANKNYTISFSYFHPDLEDGIFNFGEGTVQVLPVFINFVNITVDPALGFWNDSYNYTSLINTSLDIDVTLQTYSPCERDWISWNTKRAHPGSNVLVWTIQPFRYDCPEMTSESAKYRFKAVFEGAEYKSETRSGPAIRQGGPVLVLWDYLPEIYVPKGRQARQLIQAMVRSPSGPGEVELAIIGKGMNFSGIGRGILQGDNTYRYDWSVTFDDGSVGENYTLILTYRHPSIETDEVLGVGKMEVSSISLEFEDPSVSPQAGLWNESYNYSISINTSLELGVILQTYNPCSYEWESWSSQIAPPGNSRLSWSVAPFRCDCPEMKRNLAKYRFKADFGEFAETSDPNAGPSLYAKPEIVDLGFDEILYVTEEAEAYQVIRALVEYPMGNGNLSIRISPKNFKGSKEGLSLGGSRYLYEWSVPFDKDDLGNHTISFGYEHPTVNGGRYDFEGRRMTVLIEDVPKMDVPKLIDLDYLPIIFVDERNETYQVFMAEVSSLEGKGTLKFNLIGPDKEIEETIEGDDLGGGIYKYEWREPFIWANVHNNYKISLTYDLDGNLYNFGDRIMTVAPKGGDGAPQIWEPTLNLDYDRTLFVPKEGVAKEVISATILYPVGRGSLKLSIPGKLDGAVDGGRDLGDGKYLHEWSVPFDKTDIGKSYAISLVYDHPTLPGGRYRFADRYMNVEASPEIAKSTVEFKDPRVDPKNGSIFTLYTYCVDIDTNLTSCDVWLQILDPGATIWTPKGVAHYNGSTKTLCWPDREVDGDKDGLAKYRFVCGEYTSQDYEGPNIQSLRITSRVEPYNGSLYITKPLEGIENVYSYNYYVEIEPLPDQKSMSVDLEIYDPVARSWIFAGSQEYDPSQRWLNYTINFAKLNFREPFLGESKYRLVSARKILEEFNGPNVLVNFRGESAERMSDGTFAYRISVRSSIELLDVYVYYTNDGRTWHRSSQKPVRAYSTPGQWQEMEWKNMPRYQKLEFVAGLGGIS